MVALEYLTKGANFDRLHGESMMRSEPQKASLHFWCG
jgi:hypothetical protein